MIFIKFMIELYSTFTINCELIDDHFPNCLINTILESHLNFIPGWSKILPRSSQATLVRNRTNMARRETMIKDAIRRIVKWIYDSKVKTAEAAEKGKLVLGHTSDRPLATWSWTNAEFGPLVSRCEFIW